MAKTVADTFTAAQLKEYGNIIMNGYATTGPNTTNKKAWQYKETATPPVDLPSLTSYRPVMKGWINNTSGYYTQLQPNGYDVNPGDPTGFLYSIHSHTPLGAPKWAQPPHRSYQDQFSFLYPVADNPVPPPIGSL